MRSRWALGVAAVATAGALLRSPRAAPGLHLALLVVAFAALAVLAVSEHRSGVSGVSRRLVLAVSGGLLVLAVVVPPTESADVWSYAMYGRMAGHFHASPYRHTPAEYRADPIGARVPQFWLGSRSVYGPVFTALSTAAMAVAGTSPLLARLAFQGMAALAVALALLLVDRRTSDPMALALLGVNPVIVVSVVNGAHNDALVGLAVLGGVLLVAARRPAWAGVALAAGALVKVAALLPLVALAVWVWRHHGRRPAAAMAGTAAAVGLGTLAVTGAGSVLAALGDASTRVNRGSVWAAPHRWLLDGGWSGGSGKVLAVVATLVAAGLVALLVRRRPDLVGTPAGPALVAGGAVVAYLLVGTYVLPWYLAWGLPALALVWRWELVWVAVAQAGLLQLATARTTASGPSPGGSLLRFQDTLYSVAAPLFEVAVVVAVVVVTVRQVGRARAASGPVEPQPAAPGG